MNKLFENLSSSGWSEVERCLRAGPNRSQTPPDLHESIMHAVRQSGSEAVRTHRPAVGNWLHWITVPAAAACIVLGMLLLQPDPNDKPVVAQRPSAPAVALATPVAALKFGNNLPGALPNTLAPLSDELRRVQKDLARTADFLWATVPGS